MAYIYNVEGEGSNFEIRIIPTTQGTDYPSFCNSPFRHRRDSSSAILSEHGSPLVRSPCYLILQLNNRKRLEKPLSLLIYLLRSVGNLRQFLCHGFTADEQTSRPPLLCAMEHELFILANFSV